MGFNLSFARRRETLASYLFNPFNIPCNCTVNNGQYIDFFISS